MSDRTQTIKDALLAVQDDEIPENVNIRDDRLKGLLVGLEGAGELDDLVETLADELDTKPQEATQSEAARLFIRIGLREAAPEILEDARNAHRAALLEQADDF